MSEYGKLNSKDLKEAIENILTAKPKRNVFQGVSYCSLEQYKKVVSGVDQFNMALSIEAGFDPEEYRAKEFLRRNVMDKNQQEEYLKCKNGHNGMTGEEYFWYNYCKVNGQLPAPGSWNKEAFEKYKQEVQRKRDLQTRRRLPKNLINSLVSPEEAFYLKTKE